MPPRRSAAQIQAQIRQAQQKQRQAVRKYNSERRQAVAKVNRAIDNYNHAARRYNSARRMEMARLQRELQRLSSRSQTTTRTVSARTSVQTVVSRFQVLERSAESDLLDGAWLDLSERETANSVATLNALLDTVADADIPDTSLRALQQSDIESEIGAVGGDLADRWHGALFALNPRNHDAGRHFATSAREMLGRMLEIVAPDDAVVKANPNCPRTPKGDVSRRARIFFCLARQGHDLEQLADFVEADVTNVIDLFDEFNSGTHGLAGKFPLAQLVALKHRVEDAVRFVHAVAFGLPD